MTAQLDATRAGEGDGGYDRLPERTYRNLKWLDEQTPEIRACVHEFGTEIVRALIANGVKTPVAIRGLVHNIWMGARQPHQRNRVGRQRSPVLDSLDWILMQSGTGATAEGLLRILWQNNMVIVPKNPSTVMVQASMDAIREMGLLTRERKHRVRLQTAIEASARRLWPHLFEGKAPPSSEYGKGRT